MKKTICLILLSSLLLILIPSALARPVFVANGKEPCILSNEVYLIFNGDIWKVNISTGAQTQITSSPTLTEKQLDISSNILTFMRSDSDSIVKSYNTSTTAISDLYTASAGTLRYPRVSVSDSTTNLVVLNRQVTPTEWAYRLYSVSDSTATKVADRKGTGTEPGTTGFRAAIEGSTIIFLWRQTNRFGLKQYNIWKTTLGSAKRLLLTFNAQSTLRKIIDVNFSGNNVIYVYYDGSRYNIKRLNLTNNKITLLAGAKFPIGWIDISGRTIVYTQQDKVYRLTF